MTFPWKGRGFRPTLKQTGYYLILCVAVCIKQYLPIDGVEKSLIFLFSLVYPVRTERKTLQSQSGSLEENIYRASTHMTGTTLAPADSRVFTYEAAI